MKTVQVVVELDVPDTFTLKEAGFIVEDLMRLGYSKCAGATKDPVAIKSMKTEIKKVTAKTKPKAKVRVFA